jgi:isopentenyl-diphosphate Delta-isomerase
MAQETGKRKADHIRICLEQKAQARKATTGFEDITLVHKALPEVNREKISLFTTFLGKKLSAPLVVGAMTGGTEQAIKINGAIAQAVETLGLGMGVGSQRAALEHQNLEKTYKIAREKAPNAFLIANIGGVQLVRGYSVKEVKKAVEMINADAVAIHLNAVQEALQPEGQTNFKGILQKIFQIAGEIDIPVIVKETGCGISAEDAKALETAGVSAIDIGGLGGTSFAAVEYYRATETQIMDEAFWDWGIPTAASLIEVAQSVKIPVIASGGVRNGIDIAKSLAVGASIASVCQPVLEAAEKSAKNVEQLLKCYIDQLRDAMFLVGAEKPSDLTKTPAVITGKTAEWLNERGFNTQKYAHAGAH